MAPQQILLVEDDRWVQDILSLFFNETYAVKQAATAAEARAILDRERIAVVVPDYRLPDRSGLDLLTEIKSIRPWLPVIMITGYGSESVCAAALKLGVSDYFPKPFSLFDLLRSVRRLLSGPSPEHRRPGVVPAPEDTAFRLESLARRPDFPIQKAITLIQQRYWDRLGLSELARQVGMSKCRFSRNFKAAMGIGFRDYLVCVRLERAKDLLTTPPASITEVAQMVGFGDLPRLDKLFKRYTGLTPHTYHYRSQHRAPATTSKNPATNY